MSFIPAPSATSIGNANAGTLLIGPGVAPPGATGASQVTNGSGYVTSTTWANGGTTLAVDTYTYTSANSLIVGNWDTWTRSTPATGFTVGLSASSAVQSASPGVTVTLTPTPSGSAWNGSALTLSDIGITGTFSPSTITPSGTGAATVVFNPGATIATGTINASGTGLTSAGAATFAITQAETLISAIVQSSGTSVVFSFGVATPQPSGATFAINGGATTLSGWAGSAANTVWTATLGNTVHAADAATYIFPAAATTPALSATTAGSATNSSTQVSSVDSITSATIAGTDGVANASTLTINFAIATTVVSPTVSGFGLTIGGTAATLGATATQVTGTQWTVPITSAVAVGAAATLTVPTGATTPNLGAPASLSATNSVVTVAPGAVGSFAAGTVANLTVPLTWTAPTTGSPATGYTVNYGALSSPTWLPATGTFLGTGGTATVPAGTWQLQVVPSNAAGSGTAAVLNNGGAGYVFAPAVVVWPMVFSSISALIGIYATSGGTASLSGGNLIVGTSAYSCSTFTGAGVVSAASGTLVATFAAGTPSHDIVLSFSGYQCILNGSSSNATLWANGAQQGSSFAMGTATPSSVGLKVSISGGTATLSVIVNNAVVGTPFASSVVNSPGTVYVGAGTTPNATISQLNWYTP
jgi:hypothetical protein